MKNVIYFNLCTEQNIGKNTRIDDRIDTDNNPIEASMNCGYGNIINEDVKVNIFEMNAKIYNAIQVLKCPEAFQSLNDFFSA
ncbi:MAG: hypothetical protein IKS15_02605 [Opitutales bacterium]|nr:hypothetical protein [Opitutales bacterium]